jgi:glutathione S-transferase
MSAPKIILYTNRGCPWAHRAHIALKESGLDYEEVTIDLNKPREPWYLDVNPVSTTKLPIHLSTYIKTNKSNLKRGLVPSLSYNGNIITESGIVAQFIADAHPSHLLPPSGPTENALYRARVAFFVDAFFSKVVPHLFASLRAASDAERDDAAGLLVDAVVKEVEPLLEDGKGPFFGGSERLTLAEVCIFPAVKM